LPNEPKSIKKGNNLFSTTKEKRPRLKCPGRVEDDVEIVEIEDPTGNPR
jgi:hypothetical protein